MPATFEAQNTKATICFQGQVLRREQIAAALAAFIKKLFQPHRTDPFDIYALRWMAGRQGSERKSPGEGKPVRPGFDRLFRRRP